MRDWLLKLYHSRLTEITYPDGYEVDHKYGSAGGAGDVLNRVEAIEENTLVLAEYAYLGQTTPVITDYKDEPGVKLSYFASGQSGEAGDPYVGLDRGACPVLAGNPTGNWHGDSTGYLVKESGSTTLDQNRGHNKANEIDSITRTTGASWPAPDHDAAGNMIQTPRPLSLTNSFDLKWDAWNRLVEVKNTGGSVVASYQYDANHRRVVKTTGGTDRHYYYSDRWQVLEERLDDELAAERRYVWGVRGIDDLILREREEESSSSSSSGVTMERHYTLSDGMSITAIVDDAGTVRERYGYTGFGAPRYMSASFGSRTSSNYDWETLFHAYRYDTETGLYQVRNRYLHPNLGRWVNRDPIGERGGLNLYAFVKNNPLNHGDYLGLSDERDVPPESDAGFIVKSVIETARETLPEEKRKSFDSFLKIGRAGVDIKGFLSNAKTSTEIAALAIGALDNRDEESLALLVNASAGFAIRKFLGNIGGSNIIIRGVVEGASLGTALGNAIARSIVNIDRAARDQECRCTYVTMEPGREKVFDAVGLCKTRKALKCYVNSDDELFFTTPKFDLEGGFTQNAIQLFTEPSVVWVKSHIEA